ncbi:MAG: NAD-dependent epimerase/dehydratase family protein [Acidimicrobiales bacterium]
MRVLITGMGGELGTRVANLLERDDDVAAILGIDIDPPRRRLLRAEFHRVDPRNAERTRDLVLGFDPTAVVHLGVYEPFARSSPTSAIERTGAGSIAVFDALAEGGALDRVVVRSGIEVYGRRRGAPACPDEEVVPDPSTPFGHLLAYVERLGRELGARTDVPVTALRLAPLVGPHFPSPLGRLLRLPAVPCAALGDRPFSVLHQEDAAAAIVAALHRPHDGPLNVVGPGAVTARQAARLGGRLPVPLLGPSWRPARLLSELVGAPVPEHCRELLVRGCTADGSAVGAVLGTAPRRSTRNVIEHLYEWGDVTYLHVGEVAA